MKKCLVMTMLVVLTISFVTSLAMAADTPQQKEIKLYFEKLASLYGKKDIDAELKMFEPGGTMKFFNGNKATVEKWAVETKKDVAAYKTLKCKIVPDKIAVKGDNATVDFTETDTYTKEVKGKAVEGTVVSGWTVKMKKTKDGWKIYDFVEHYEKESLKK